MWANMRVRFSGRSHVRAGVRAGVRVCVRRACGRAYIQTVPASDVQTS